MHTQDASFLSDWQRQRLSIHVDRAVTELRRGRPLLMVDGDSIDSLLPKGVQGPSNVWLFAAVETLTPDGWGRAAGRAPPCASPTPVATPPNTLVLGPGQFRFMDYVKVGVPLVIVSLIVCLVVIPLVWPF